MKQIFKLQDYLGKKLHVVEWTPDKRTPIAVVQVIHGLAEHSERYSKFASVCNSIGLAVVAHDHRGHGKTDPFEPGSLDVENGFDTMAKNIGDVYQQVKNRFENLPVVMLGHSMGSFLLQRYLQIHDEEPNAIIYSGSNGKPPLMLNAGILLASVLRRLEGDNARSKMIFNLSFGKYNKRFRPNRTEADWLSRDPAMVDLYIDDPNSGFICTNYFYHQFFTGLKKLHAHRPFVNHSRDLPILIVSGTQDPVSNMGRGIRNLEKILKKSGCKDLTVNLYEGARHELLNETNRDEVISDILSWIENKIQERGNA